MPRGRVRYCLPVFLLLSLFVLAGCGALSGDGEEEPAPAVMHVAVNFGDVHRCSRISPEIAVYNPPAGTEWYEVRVAVEGDRSRYLSASKCRAGSVNEEGADIIPEGGLSASYRAPCPSGSGRDRIFRFTVLAMKSGSSQPLASSDFVLTLDQ